MTIPNLPTDNLYKFIALTGVILLVITIFYPEIRRQELNEQIIQLNGEIEKQEYESALLVEQNKNLKRKIENLDRICKCGTSIVNDSLIVRPVVTSGPEDLVALSREIEILIKEQAEISKQNSLKAIEIDTKNNLIKDKKASLHEISEIANELAPLSLVIAFLGFIFWYEQTQKYQDKVLKSQFDELTKSELCQSCGMKLRDQEEWLLYTKEQKEKIKYCNNCYDVDIGFVDPKITYNEMKKRVRYRCEELGFTKIKTHFYLMRLSSLERWQAKFNWKKTDSPTENA